MKQPTALLSSMLGQTDWLLKTLKLIKVQSTSARQHWEVIEFLFKWLWQYLVVIDVSGCPETWLVRIFLFNAEGLVLNFRCKIVCFFQLSNTSYLLGTFTLKWCCPSLWTYWFFFKQQKVDPFNVVNIEWVKIFNFLLFN